ncbi:MAG: RNA methyltransferase [Bdellovibrionales bacterium]|nr:RNA methyltransferase [Bdellovibrionales bacterium]
MDDDLDFSRARLAWSNPLQVGDLSVTAEQVLSLLDNNLTDERRARLHEVVAMRSLHLVPVLENIYDRGNVSAAMRSSEAFGFLQMCLVDGPGAKFKAANRVTRGAEKWLDVKSFSTPAACVSDLKERGYQIWATDLDTQDSIDTLDWTKPTAIVLGNEKDGVSAEMRGLVDGRFRIPMLGFSQSFNISVAAALIFYRAHLESRRLGDKALLNEEQRRQVLANYYLRCFDNPENLLRAKLERMS